MPGPNLISGRAQRDSAVTPKHRTPTSLRIRCHRLVSPSLRYASLASAPDVVIMARFVLPSYRDLNLDSGHNV